MEYTIKYYPMSTEYCVLIMTFLDVENIFLLIHPKIVLLSWQAHSTFDTNPEEFLEPGVSWEMF